MYVLINFFFDVACIYLYKIYSLIKAKLHFKTGKPNQQYINIPKSGVDGIVACVISYHGFKVNPYLEMLTVL